MGWVQRLHEMSTTCSISSLCIYLSLGIYREFVDTAAVTLCSIAAASDQPARDLSDRQQHQSQLEHGRVTT